MKKLVLLIILLILPLANALETDCTDGIDNDADNKIDVYDAPDCDHILDTICVPLYRHSYSCNNCQWNVYSTSSSLGSSYTKEEKIGYVQSTNKYSNVVSLYQHVQLCEGCNHYYYTRSSWWPNYEKQGKVGYVYSYKDVFGDRALKETYNYCGNCPLFKYHYNVNHFLTYGGGTTAYIYPSFAKCVCDVRNVPNIGPPETICNDFIDNDCDGKIDSEDEDCVAECTDTTWSPLSSTVCQGESFSQTSNCGDTRTATGTMTCTSGTCSNGVCIPTQTECTDSDGGEYLFVKGTVSLTYSTSTYTDLCKIYSGWNGIREYFCTLDGNLYSRTYQCPTTCSNGACDGPITKVCRDDDGANYYTKSIVMASGTDGIGHIYTDECSPSTTLKEYICAGDVKAEESYTCPDGCSNGACIEVCTDTAWSPNPSIICLGELFTQTSNCGNTRTTETGTKTCLSGYTCSNRVCVEEVVTCTIDNDCPTGYKCDDATGTCVINCNTPCDQFLTQPLCEDPACSGECIWDIMLQNCNPSPIEQSCGNNIAGFLEECDGSDFKKQTCDTLGYGTGTLYCNVDCTLDILKCSAECTDVQDSGKGCEDYTTFNKNALCETDPCTVSGGYGCYLLDESCTICDFDDCEIYTTNQSCDNNPCDLGPSCLWDLTDPEDQTTGYCTKNNIYTETINEEKCSSSCKGVNWTLCTAGIKTTTGDCEILSGDPTICAPTIRPQVSCRVTKEFPFFSSKGIIVVLILLVGYYVFVNFKKKK